MQIFLHLKIIFHPRALSGTPPDVRRERRFFGKDVISDCYPDSGVPGDQGERH
jgi:hypothetical protein